MKTTNKKDNHILLNLTDAEYLIIKKLAEWDRRSVSELARLILCDNAKQIFLDRQTNKDNFQKAIYKR